VQNECIDNRTGRLEIIFLFRNTGNEVVYLALKIFVT